MKSGREAPAWPDHKAFPVRDLVLAVARGLTASTSDRPALTYALAFVVWLLARSPHAAAEYRSNRIYQLGPQQRRLGVSSQGARFLNP